MRGVRRRLRPFSLAAAAAAFAVVGATASVASADVSSWLAVGGGYASQRNHDTGSRDRASTLTYSIGVGSSPLSTLVVGLVFRGTTMFGLGTDVGAALRLSTGGFARGSWGVALDAGALWRSWGAGTHGDWPLQGVLTVGVPWGIQLAAGGQVWSLDGGNSALGLFAAAELDLLRFTVMRQGPGDLWWPNPNPAGGKLVGLLW
jgi:hypothetical protein